MPWEKFRINPLPSCQPLEALAVVVKVEAERLQEMLSTRTGLITHPCLAMLGFRARSNL